MRLTPFKAILFGGLTVAVLDIADAFIFYAFYGATPVRILQSIAVGVLGRDAAYRGGAATAMFGACLHCVISLSIVTVFYVGASKLPVLARRPWLSGTAYGLAVYLTMYLVVLPLSRVGMPNFKHVGPVLDEIFIHIFGVGIPAALFVRAAGPGATIAS
jgi:uncharacterized membrane protein YagU involved in acid resistance